MHEVALEQLLLGEFGCPANSSHKLVKPETFIGMTISSKRSNTMPASTASAGESRTELGVLPLAVKLLKQ